jgi:hypothetical protein
MSRLRQALAMILNLMRELSDEAGYRRHLAAHGVEASASEWRRYSDERMRAKYTRPKCC